MTPSLSAAMTRSEFSTPPRSKVECLRKHLRQAELDGLLVPSADAHLNEYLPETWQRRQWLTGFTGSAGDALISLTQAWLTVDSRYYEQADQQVDIEVIQVIKLGLSGHSTLEEVIEELGVGFRLGVDPFTVSVHRFQDLDYHCAIGGVELVPTSDNIIDRVRAEWEGEQLREIGGQPVFSVPVEIAGSTIVEKLEQVRHHMAKRRIGLLPVTKLDQLAWLLNLRGSDIPYNPVFIAYGLVGSDRVALFTPRDRLQEMASREMEQAGVEVYDYGDYGQHLCDWADRYGIVGVAPQHTTQGTVNLLGSRPTRQLSVHPIEALKARKNAVELECMRWANRRASRAKIRTLAWIDRQIERGEAISEADVARIMRHHYQQEPEWCGLSFTTIAGAGANSSIVHYGTPDPDQLLSPGSLLLLDSGSQFRGGTTDDTRTVIMGEPTDLQRQRYTLVLKAHLQCASQQFPVDTPGTQLDGIARYSLWQAGLNYGHGTGHGVGAFLNVHEGPIGISKRSHTALEPGMITSIEPGYYEPGWGGIRIENLCEVQAVPDREGWLRFEPLTWIPFARRLIDESLLTKEQRDWVQRYHQTVFEMFAPELDEAEIEWLRWACSQN